VTDRRKRFSGLRLALPVWKLTYRVTRLADCGGGGDREKQDSAEPEDDEQQDDGADGGLRLSPLNAAISY